MGGPTPSEPSSRLHSPPQIGGATGHLQLHGVTEDDLLLWGLAPRPKGPHGHPCLGGRYREKARRGLGCSPEVFP